MRTPASSNSPWKAPLAKDTRRESTCARHHEDHLDAPPRRSDQGHAERLARHEIRRREDDFLAARSRRHVSRTCSTAFRASPGPVGMTCTVASPRGGCGLASPVACSSSSGSFVSTYQSARKLIASASTAGPSMRTMASIHWPTPASRLNSRGSAMFRLPV